MLSLAEIDQLIQLRQKLHQFPELSGQEVYTAKTIIEFLRQYQPDQIFDTLSSNAVIAVYDSGKKGKHIMFRCELDALPIKEAGSHAYISQNSHIAHSCGHDGHMAIICGLAMSLAKNRPKNGKVILLFQPAEETGQGAKALLEPMKLAKLVPDYSFAMHNMPKIKLHDIIIKDGIFNCASVGMQIELIGKTSHASHPENGISPVEAVCEILAEVKLVKDDYLGDDIYSSISITHSSVGEKSFGVTAGEGLIMLTLRSESDTILNKIQNQMEIFVQKTAQKYGLGYDVKFVEAFETSNNQHEAADLIRHAVNDLGIPMGDLDKAWRASEDFGQYAKFSKSAMFLLGSGIDQPQLHNPDYDFPDALITTGHRVFMRLIKNILD